MKKIEPLFVTYYDIINEYSNTHKENGCFSCENGATEQIWFKVKGSGLRVDIIHKKPFNVEAERLSIILSIIFYPNVKREGPLLKFASLSHLCFNSISCTYF